MVHSALGPGGLLHRTAEMQLALTQSEVFTQRPEVWQCYSGTHLLCKRHAFAFARKHRVYAS
eukprot:1157745-Pelagomonas_calceolata.AAC.9